MKSKKENLTTGENTLVNVFSTAINHVPDFLDNVEGLFNHLGETLFKPDFTAYMIDVKFEIPVENDLVWQIYFPRLTELDTFQSSSLSTKRKNRKERDSIAKEAIISTTVQAAKKTRHQKSTQTKTKKTAQNSTNPTQHRTQMVEWQGKGEGQGKKQISRKVNAGNSSPINDHRRNKTPPGLVRKRGSISQVGGGQKMGRKHLRKIVKTGFVSPISVHHKRSSETVPPKVIRKTGKTSTLRRSPRKLLQPKELSKGL